jgi:hypothetical protein
MPDMFGRLSACQEQLGAQHEDHKNRHVDDERPGLRHRADSK